MLQKTLKPIALKRRRRAKMKTYSITAMWVGLMFIDDVEASNKHEAIMKVLSLRPNDEPFEFSVYEKAA